ncbi:MAG: PqqD family protein [Candidatus Gallimonas sp.]
MKIKKGFCVRRVGEENIAVPVGERSKEFRGMIKLNETGNFLWDFFTKEHTVGEAVKALCDEYEVDAETAEQDVARFISVLTENGFAE